jgi:hypothetical protein
MYFNPDFESKSAFSSDIMPLSNTNVTFLSFRLNRDFKALTFFLSVLTSAVLPGKTSHLTQDPERN